MLLQGVNKIRIIAVASLLTLASTSAPVKAHHGHDYVAPLAAFIAFGALLHHSHHRHHYHRYHGHGHGHGHGHSYKHKRRHSHSSGRGGHGHKKHRNW